MDVKHWITQAERLRTEDAYTYQHFARDLTRQLTWTGAVDVATALRGHVYGWTGSHPLHKEIEPLYTRLGWEQAALIAAWFRNERNRPQRRPGGWPAAVPSRQTERIAQGDPDDRHP
ncbi:hypothetical protein AB0N17_03560 [Streptomyces sp. NPDC051133]|uniref:hypothetical protein n=1 Tax=Streptomyces sp. NPDC051133 TaxID=3155521 RepID=UPI00342376D7